MLKTALVSRRGGTMSGRHYSTPEAALAAMQTLARAMQEAGHDVRWEYDGLDLVGFTALRAGTDVALLRVTTVTVEV